MARELTEKQDKWIDLVIQGVNTSRAAEICGYAFPEKAGYDLKTNPAVQKELISRQLSALSSEILPKSLRRLDEILDDTSAAPAGIKLKAAQYVIDKVTELQNMASAADIANKNPLEMTAAELEVFVMRGRVVLSREKALQDLGIVEPE